jgi:lipoyl(octanoyl) transferase
MKHWRFIDSGPSNAAFNMALDEVLLGRVAAGESPPVLRVYRWSEPSVSLGYHQKLERELDLGLCRSRGVEVVRRPTGGRSVYHDLELTYSLCAPGDTDILGDSISSTSAAVAGAIRMSLELLGFIADIPQKHKTGTVQRGAAGMRNPCFTSASRHEVTTEGRKLVGSAQLRLPGGEAFLQQGSLLLANSQQVLVELKPGCTDQAQREKLKNSLNLAVTSLGDILGREVSYQETADCFRTGFTRYFGIELLADGPEPDEIRMAEQLAEERYLSKEWLAGSGRKARLGEQVAG